MTKTQEEYERLGNESTGAERQQAMHVQNTPRPTAVLPSSSATNRRQMHKNKLFGMGITECCLGALSLALAIATYTVDKEGSPHALYNFQYLLTYTSQGAWAGVFLIITGILGICTRTKPSVAMYNANMAMSIITAVFGGIALLLSGLASAASPRSALLSLHVIITILLFTGFIVSIVHSAFCCAGVCRSKQEHVGTVVYIPQVAQHQQIGGIPSIQYVVPAGTVIPPQSGSFLAQSSGAAAIATSHTTQPVASGAAFNETLESPPGYSTLPKQEQ